MDHAERREKRREKIFLFKVEKNCKYNTSDYSIDGSTDRYRIPFVTNQRALLSGSDQPERKLGRRRIWYVRRENKLSKTATFARW